MAPQINKNEPHLSGHSLAEVSYFGYNGEVSLHLMRGFGIAVGLCFACSLPYSSVTASRAIWEPSTSSSGGILSWTCDVALVTGDVWPVW